MTMHINKALGIVWDALDNWHDAHIGDGSDPEIPIKETWEPVWDDLCEAMAVIHESLNIEQGDI